MPTNQKFQGKPISAPSSLVALGGLALLLVGALYVRAPSDPLPQAAAHAAAVEHASAVAKTLAKKKRHGEDPQEGGVGSRAAATHGHDRTSEWTPEYSIPELEFEQGDDCDPVRPQAVNNCLKMHAKKKQLVGDMDAREAWHKLHSTLAKDSQAQASRSKVVFLGDSITESWRGTNWGQACKRCKGVPDVFQQHFGQHNAVALGIGCDGTQHLNWRLQHGEVAGLDPAVAVLLIGTNNLGVCNATGKSTFQGAPHCPLACPIMYLRARLSQPHPQHPPPSSSRCTRMLSLTLRFARASAS